MLSVERTEAGTNDCRVRYRGLVKELFYILPRFFIYYMHILPRFLYQQKSSRKHSPAFLKTLLKDDRYLRLTSNFFANAFVSKLIPRTISSTAVYRGKFRSPPEELYRFAGKGKNAGGNTYHSALPECNEG